MKMNSKTTPAIMKMVVKDMVESVVSGQWAVGSGVLADKEQNQ